MRETLTNLIRGSVSGKILELAVFDTRSEQNGSAKVVEGILFDPASREAYPICDGVPIMLENVFTQAFLDRHRAAIADDTALSGFKPRAGPPQDWSFTRQWDEFFETDSHRTWGYNVKERVEQFLMETKTDRAWLNGKKILDAGCGNGILTEEIGNLGASVVGLDYSSCVVDAEHRRQSDNVNFIQGDLQAPPLADGRFDVVFSIGVLMCTPDTLRSFRGIARLVRPGGKLYVWVYRRPERFLGRYIKVPVYDLLRLFISRLPKIPQELSVKAYARMVRLSHNLRDPNNTIPLREYVVSAYDDMTPKWRRYHTPIEVSRWFHECGFSAPTLSHWDNPYGFGLVATKEPQEVTPGIHYGDGAKLWENEKTLLGRLHRD